MISYYSTLHIHITTAHPVTSAAGAMAGTMHIHFTNARIMLTGQHQSAQHVLNSRSCLSTPCWILATQSVTELLHVMQVHVAVAGTETDHLAKLITEKAEELDAACVIMASHGKTSFQVFLLTAMSWLVGHFSVMHAGTASQTCSTCRCMHCHL